MYDITRDIQTQTAGLVSFIRVGDEASPKTKGGFMKWVSKMMSVAALNFVLASCGEVQASNTGSADATSTATRKNIVEVAQEAGNFKTLLKAAQVAGLANTLATANDITVFAPTDEAFAKLPKEALEGLLKNPEALKNVLLYHVVGSKVPAKVAVTLTEATMLNGQKVSVEFNSDGLFINQSKVIAADVAAKNGLIHVIDEVLIP
jgi:uncharacterized surface protein with fasciclin (FAS1) repeats